MDSSFFFLIEFLFINFINKKLKEEGLYDASPRKILFIIILFLIFFKFNIIIQH
jgi:hypothetical protein